MKTPGHDWLSMSSESKQALRHRFGLNLEQLGALVLDTIHERRSGLQQEQIGRGRHE